jgi:hypothetical protein
MLLAQAGFATAFTDFVITQIKDEISSLRNNQPSEHGLTQAIEELTMNVCQRSKEMSVALRKSRAARSLLLGFGGFGIIITNIASSNELSSIGIAASAGIGGALVKDSVTALSEELLL